MGYHKEFPDVKFEIISVDQNHGANAHFQGGSTCHGHMSAKKQEGENLIKERARVSRDDTTYLLMQHYPFRNDHVRRIWRDNGGRGTLISAYGHDHNCKVDGTSILSGGGGG